MLCRESLLPAPKCQICFQLACASWAVCRLAAGRCGSRKQLVVCCQAGTSAPDAPPPAGTNWRGCRVGSAPSRSCRRCRPGWMRSTTSGRRTRACLPTLPAKLVCGDVLVSCVLLAACPGHEFACQVCMILAMLPCRRQAPGRARGVQRGAQPLLPVRHCLLRPEPRNHQCARCCRPSDEHRCPCRLLHDLYSDLAAAEH